MIPKTIRQAEAGFEALPELTADGVQRAENQNNDLESDCGKMLSIPLFSGDILFGIEDSYFMEGEIL